MDQNGGGGSGHMANMYGMQPDELQMGMSGMMNLDMGMDGMDVAMSPEYAGMMDQSDKNHLQREANSQYADASKMNHMLMPGFGGPTNDLDGFQFDPNTSIPAGMGSNFVSSPAISAGTPNSVANSGIAKRRMDKQRAQRRASSGNIALNTDFSNLNSGIISSSQSPNYPMTAIGVPMNMEGGYGGFGNIGMSMDMNMGMGQGHNDMSGLGTSNMYANHGMTGPAMQQMNQPTAPSPSRRQSFPNPHHPPRLQHQQSSNTSNSTPGHENSNGQQQPQQQQKQQQQQQQQQSSQKQHQHQQQQKHQQQQSQQQLPQKTKPSNAADEQMMMQKIPQLSMSDAYRRAQILTEQYQNAMQELQMSTEAGQNDSYPHSQPPLNERNTFYGYDTNQQRNMNSFSTANTNIPGGPGGEALPGQQSIPQYLNAYSSTGFDMLTVLMKVATRQRPRINIGAVDLSCAFVVCDVSQHDVPIVYCSEMFERLTGYTRHEILARNCRFLQAPDGRVESGVKRKYVDDRAVLHLKNMINQRQEAQISLINYRKGGQPFMNLLTMIPITWDTDEIRYYVGFQVDLVEQPGAVTNKNPDGTYQVNYQRSELEPYQVPRSTPKPADAELDRSIGNDEVSTVLANIGQNESEISRRIWDKVLLENTDDVVHVLSLKGLFLYLSPSCKKVLEYDPHELVGTALSSVCHPSDIVPVTRELKDTSSGANVNVVFRIRRKHSGYTWFESHGTLHLEQGKAKKCIILVGRERPVYALLRNQIVGGFGEQELWTKMSTTGMFLYVSHNVKQLLDRLPEDLVGSSAQNLMRQDSKVAFGQALELGRTGTKATFKHDVQNKRGQTLHAETTLYPGDADEGKKPTFLVAQTRLVKMSRGQPALLKQSSSTSERSQGFFNSVDSQSPNTNSTGISGGQHASRPTPMSLLSHGQGTPAGVIGQGGQGYSYGQVQGHSHGSNQGQLLSGVTTSAGGHALALGNQDEALAADENVFDELKTTRSTSWQFELRQMEKRNRLLAEELQSLLSSKKKRKRRKGLGQLQKDCANCHTRNTPEWRRGPSGQRDLCNSCGLRWAKQQGRVSPRTSSQHSGDKHSSASSPRGSLSGGAGGGGSGGTVGPGGGGSGGGSGGVGDKLGAGGLQGSPLAHASPQHAANAGQAVKMETSGNQNTPGPAAMGERSIPSTIQEGEEPADEEL